MVPEPVAGALDVDHVGAMGGLWGVASILAPALPFRRRRSASDIAPLARLGVDDLGYGLILAASAIGGLVGFSVIARVRARMRYRMTIVVSLLAGAASLFALSVTTNGPLAPGLLAVHILHVVVRGICAASLR